MLLSEKPATNNAFVIWRYDGFIFGLYLADVLRIQQTNKADQQVRRKHQTLK